MDCAFSNELLTREREHHHPIKVKRPDLLRSVYDICEVHTEVELGSDKVYLGISVVTYLQG